MTCFAQWKHVRAYVTLSGTLCAQSFQGHCRQAFFSSHFEGMTRKTKKEQNEKVQQLLKEAAIRRHKAFSGKEAEGLIWVQSEARCNFAIAQPYFSNGVTNRYIKISSISRFKVTIWPSRSAIFLTKKMINSILFGQDWEIQQRICSEQKKEKATVRTSLCQGLMRRLNEWQARQRKSWGRWCTHQKIGLSHRTAHPIEINQWNLCWGQTLWS